MSDHSDFSGGSGGGGNDQKHKKDRKKVKERPYAHLGEDLSSADEDNGNNEKSPVKVKKSKAFMFGSAKKDKKKEGNFSSGLSGLGASDSVGGESKKKEKSKLKLKKSSKLADKLGADELVDEEPAPIFGVPLGIAVTRHKCYDGIKLPLLVRECIDFIEHEGGIKSEGIYRSSGVKSKVNKLKAIYDSPSKRAFSGSLLHNYDFTVVASVLKLFLRELPEPVLTKNLTPRFEVVSSYTDQKSRIEGIKALMDELPECNRVLIQWVFVHMTHVIERERFNKMTLQNVSIVLSPTLKISHRVLNVFFENSHLLFGGISLKRYVPPLTAETLNKAGLPESPCHIEEEIRKQDSLLADLHLQISSGAASKKTEEQVWEQQRIVTQLKRKLRLVKKKIVDQEVNDESSSGTVPKPKYEPIDYNEVLDFTLQTPVAVEEKVVLSESEDPSYDEPCNSSLGSPVQMDAFSPPKPLEEEMSPPPNTEVKTVAGEMTEAPPDTQQLVLPPKEEAKEEEKNPFEVPASQTNVTVIRLGEDEADASSAAAPPTGPKVAFKLPSSTNTGSSIYIPPSPGFPLLPPPPGKSGNSRHQRVLQPVPASPPKSKSLPRGFPLAPSEIYDFFENEDKKQQQEQTTATTNTAFSSSPQEEEEPSGMSVADVNLLEVLKLEFEYDELMALKSELIRRKEIEKKEILELKEEIASMQTLYQYRTCSVDSSESSSDEASDKEDGIEELAKTLSDLIRENKELEDTRMELQQKIQDERAACISLRVLIKVEQEKIRLKAKRCF